MSEGSVGVAAGDLAAFASAFERLGAPAADARAVAELMVEADLLGYETHGVFRLRRRERLGRRHPPAPQSLEGARRHRRRTRHPPAEDGGH
jgi:hypothetical protein